MAKGRTRLRKSRCALPGITRRGRGRGFEYRWQDDDTRVDDPEILQRIRDLVIPPAWRDVWICPYANGHIQAVGRDAAGRKQYRYHDSWRLTRDAAKHDHVLEIARDLPRVRESVTADLGTRGLNRRRVLSTAVRLLDLGFFRVGGERYAEENESYGLATVLREHTTVGRGGVVTFEYPAKSGRERHQAVADPEVVAVVRALLRRTDDGPELLAYRQRDGWHDVRSAEVNDHLQELFGRRVSAKDFRTWHATVLAAVGLAVSAAVDSPTARKRAVARVVREVSDYLGNTPAVARASYIDPRLVDLYLDGDTVEPDLPGLGASAAEGHLAHEGEIERAVLALLDDA